MVRRGWPAGAFGAETLPPRQPLASHLHHPPSGPTHSHPSPQPPLLSLLRSLSLSHQAGAPPSAPVIYPTKSVGAAAASVLAALLSDALTAGRAGGGATTARAADSGDGSGGGGTTASEAGSAADPDPGQTATRDPLARARCEGGVAALFPGRSVMVAQRLKDPCAILVREAARRVADAVAGGGGPGAPDPAPLTSGAGPEGGGLRTPTPPPTLSVRASVAPAGIAPAAPAGIAPAGTSAGSGTVGLLWVRRNETRGGDVVLGAGGR